MSDRLPLNVLQQWLYSTLATAATSWATTATIVDEVGENPVFPYVEIGHFEEDNANEKARAVMLVYQRVNIFSDAPGTLELNRIIEQVGKAVSSAAFPVVLGEDFTLGMVQREGVEADKEFDERSGKRLRIATVRFRMHITDDET